MVDSLFMQRFMARAYEFFFCLKYPELVMLPYQIINVYLTDICINSGNFWKGPCA